MYARPPRRAPADAEAEQFRADLVRAIEEDPQVREAILRLLAQRTQRPIRRTTTTRRER
jgi:hypothetical protein